MVDPGGAAGRRRHDSPPPPPMGPNSFAFAYRNTGSAAESNINVINLIILITRLETKYEKKLTCQVVPTYLSIHVLRKICMK